MGRWVIAVRMKFPLFSSSSGGGSALSFQVKNATPLPLPMPLLGALGKAWALWKAMNGNPIDAQGRDIGQVVVEQLNRRVIPTAKLHNNSIALQNFVLLQRTRAMVDKKSLKMDAMRREYIFADEVYVFYLTKEQEIRDEISRCVWLIERIGDTESLGAVVGVEEIGEGEIDESDNETLEHEVNTVFPRSFASNFEGGIVLLGANGICFSGSGVGTAEYVLPLRRKKLPKYGVWNYEPSSIQRVRPADGVKVWKFRAFGEEVIALWKDNFSLVQVEESITGSRKQEQEKRRRRRKISNTKV